MATRHLQRLRAQLSAQAEPEHEPSEDDASDSETPVPSQGNAFNPFDLLSDDEVAQEEEEDDNDTIEPADDGNVKTDRGPAQKTCQQGASTTKQKKKKKKTKTKQRGDLKAGADAAGDDVLEALLELSIPTGERSQGNAASTSGCDAPRPLQISARRLKAEEELRRLFGKEVLALEREAQRDSRTRDPGHHGAHGRVRRQYILVSANEPRLPYDGSLDMRSLGPSSDGGTIFEYTFTNAYRTAETMFEQAQATMDPNNIVAVLQRFPFHVGSYIAMHDLYLVTDQQDTATRMLEGALYTLESAWHPQFKSQLLAGTARLPFEKEGNAQFFQVLLRMIQALGRRGCHQTALEWCKLLLSLDFNDPMGVLFHADYFALRSAQYSFVNELADHYPGDQSLRLLPSYAFSCALADFFAYRAARQAAGTEAATATGVHTRDENPALDAQLINAILTFPVVVSALIEALQEQGAAQDAAWASVSKRKLLRYPHAAGSKTLSHLAAIFVTRNALIWKGPDVLAWLLRCCQDAADVADGVKVPDDGDDARTLSYDDAAALCSVSYHEDDENEYRHCLVHNYSESTAHVAQEHLAALAAHGGDGPAAPNAAGNARQAGGIPLQALRGANPILMLLRTMLPWVNVGPEAAAEGEAPPAAPPANDLAAVLRQHGLEGEFADLTEEQRELLNDIVNGFMAQQGPQ